jgi:predicted transcriptional regulator
MRSDRRERRRSPLGLGPLETAIMRVLWDAGTWLTIRDVRERMDYGPVAYTTVATVASILHGKDLLIREPDNPEGSSGAGVWWYRAARPMHELIGELIATLLRWSPDPQAVLAHAIAAQRTPSSIQPSPGAHAGHPQGAR